MKQAFSRYLLMAFVVASQALFSCSDRDDDNPNEEEEIIEHFNQLDYLQGALVALDESGAVTAYKYGYQLDPADPTTLSVQADNLAEAQAAFKSLFSPDVAFREDSDHKIYADLTDEDGKTQGSVIFTPTTGEPDGAFAKVTFRTVPEFKHISELRYLPRLGDENRFYSSRYRVGDKATKGAGIEGQGEWVCIREATAKHKGMRIYLSKKGYYAGDIKPHTFASAADARAVGEILRQDWKKYAEMVRKYLSYGIDWRAVWIGGPSYEWRHAIHFESGREFSVSTMARNIGYPYLLVEYFDVTVVE